MLLKTFVIFGLVCMCGCATSAKSSYQSNLNQIEAAHANGEISKETYLRLKLEAERNYQSDRNARIAAWNSSFSTNEKEIYDNHGHQIGTIR